MRKILSVGMAFLMCLSLFACGEQNHVQSKSEPKLIAAKRGFSSKETADMPASNLVDGDTKTACATGALDAQVNEYFAVDLGKNYDISNAKFTWGVSRGKACKIEYSRGGVEYTTVTEINDQSAKIDEVTFESGTIARYVRVSVSKADASAAALGLTMCEIEVYGIDTDDQTLGGETESAPSPVEIVPTLTNCCITNKAYEPNVFQWCGSEIRFKTTETRVLGFNAECENEAYLNISIDGGEFEKLYVKGKVNYMFDIEGSEAHEVRIVRASEPHFQPITIKNIIIEETAELVEGYTPDYSCKIQIFGDSLSAGYGLDMFTDVYGFKMSEQLNAQTIYSTKGAGSVYTPNSEDYDDFHIPNFLHTTQYKGEFDYDYEFQPDLVIVAAGVNDSSPYTRISDAEKPQFEKEMQQAFFDFFVEIHEKLPNAKILYSRSTGFNIDEHEGSLMNDRVVSAAINDFKAKYPDAVIEKIYFEHKIDTTDDDWHSGKETNERDSYIIADKVREMLNLK